MQKVTGSFMGLSDAITREPKSKLKISWNRSKDENIDFAVVGTSVVDGKDIIRGQLTVITQSDLFEYKEESENLIAFGLDREIVEPLGGLSYSRGTIILENTSGRYTPKFDDEIGQYIIPNRPIKLYSGFKNRFNNDNELIPIIYGLTTTPLRNITNSTTKIDIYDYLSIIDEYELELNKYVNKRADEIIADILDEVGFTSEQYSLDESLNTIGFAYFPKGTKAGDAIRRLCEAEEGFFYQDELGLLRFDNRRKYIASDYVDTKYEFTKDMILRWEELDSTAIINRAEVEAYPREVQPITEIWKSGGTIELQVGLKGYEIWANFQDPADSITTPVATTDYLVNTASDGSGIDITSQVAITINKFVTDAKLNIDNNYSGTAYITFLRLRGQSAQVVQEIQETYEDLTSQETYGTKTVRIKNDFITTDSFAYYLARILVQKYRDGIRRIKITIPARPQLQLRDRIEVEDRDTGQMLEMRIMRIQETMDINNGYLQDLTLREITDRENDTPAIVDISLVDGEDIVWI